jgi:hypothetical protein
MPQGPIRPGPGTCIVGKGGLYRHQNHIRTGDVNGYRSPARVSARLTGVDPCTTCPGSLSGDVARDLCVALVAESGKVRVDGCLGNKALRCCLRI